MNPITISLTLGAVSLIITLAIFLTVKPSYVMKSKKKPNWLKLLSFCSVVAVGVALSSFLVIVKDRKLSSEPKRSY